MTACAHDPAIENSEPAFSPDPLVSRSKVPALITNEPPAISRGDFVITLITPDMALAPHTADAGPRMTSICLISFMFTGRKSHAMNPKKSWYRLRPSIRASCDVDSVDVAPRLVMLMSRAEVCVTLTPGTERNRSPYVCAGALAIDWLEMSETVAGAFTSFCSVRVAVTTTCSS